MLETHPKRAFRALAAAGLFAGVVLSGCSSGAVGDLVRGGPRPPVALDPEIELTAAGAKAPHEGGSLSVEVRNAGGGALNWTASVSGDHARISGSSSGTGNGTVTVRFEANDGAERTAVVTVRSSGASNSPQTVTLTQEEAPPAPTLDAEVDGFAIDPDGETLSIGLRLSGEDIEWQAASPAESWARIMGRASGAGDGTLSVQVDANDSGDSRSLTLTVRLTETPSVEVELHFSQAAQPPVRLEAVAERTLLPAAGGDAVVTVTLTGSGGAWTAAIATDPAPSWVQIIPSGDRLTVTAQANPTDEQRFVLIEFSSDEAANSPQAVRITQEAAELPVLTVGADDHRVDSGGELVEVDVRFSGPGARDAAWTASSSETFARIVGSPRGTGNGSVSVSVTANDGQERRHFTITVTPQSGEAEPYVFEQGGTRAPFLEVTGGSAVVPHTGGTARLRVRNRGGGRMHWLAAVEESWASISGAAGGVDTGYVIVVIDPNEGEDPRNLVVTVTAEAAENTRAPITIRQAAAPEQALDAARVSANKYSAAPTGDSITITIDVSGDQSLRWRAQAADIDTSVCVAAVRTPGDPDADPPVPDTYEEVELSRGDWVGFLGPDSGSGDGTIRVNVDANNGVQDSQGAIRCRTIRWAFSITVEFPDAPELNQTLHFSQDPHTADTALNLWTRSRHLDIAGETREVHLTIIGTEQVYWEACLSYPPEDENRDWAHLEGPITGTVDGSGSAVIRVRVDSNTGAQRTFTLTAAEDECPSGSPQDTIRLTQAGRSSLSIADASANEGDANMEFKVSLDPPAPRTVTVRYETADGTATAGSDYTAASGTLTFRAGSTLQTLRVRVRDDNVDDDGETFTVTLSNASGAIIEDAVATGTINNTDPIPSAWLARFGRTASAHVADAIQSRLERRSRAPHATFAGRRAGQPFTALRGAQGRTARLPAENGMAMPAGFGGLGAGSAFFHGGALDADARAGERWAVWGRTAMTRFDGAEGTLVLDGEVATATLGVDSERERWLAGVVLAYSTGQGGYADPKASGGEVASRLFGVHPYARYALSDRAHVWGTLGYGAGSMTLTPDRAAPMDTDLSHAMAAFGGRGVLSVHAGDAGSFELALRSDAAVSRTASGATGSLAGAAGVAGWARAVFEGTGSLALGSSGAIEPSLEVGVRYDAGDAETGAGVEVGAGLAYRSGRFAVEAGARSLALHQDSSYREWGYSTSLRYSSRPDGRGLALDIGSSWGIASATNAIWHAGRLPGALPPSRRRMQLQAGYGLAVPGQDAVWTPFAGLDSVGDGSRGVRVGIRLSAGPRAHAVVEAGMRGRPLGGTEYAVRVTGRFWPGQKEAP